MAESEGFEPSIRFPVYTLSRGAPSATRPALPILVCYRFTTYAYADTWRTCALFRASCPSPFGLASLVQNRSRRFCQPLGQLSQFLFDVDLLHTRTPKHGARARYSGRPAFRRSRYTACANKRRILTVTQHWFPVFNTQRYRQVAAHI